MRLLIKTLTISIALAEEKVASLKEYIKLREQGEKIDDTYSSSDFDDEEENEEDRARLVDLALRGTYISDGQPSDSAFEDQTDTGFARTQTYRGHGAGAMKPAGRRLNSNQPTAGGNGVKTGKKAKRPALGR